MRPITDVLIEFTRVPSPPPDFLTAGPFGMPDFLPDIAILSEPDSPEPSHEQVIEDLVTAARQSGQEEAKALAEADHAAEIAALRDGHEAAIEAARAGWAASEGAVLAEAFRAGLAAIEQAVCRGVADVLLPVLDEALRRRAAEEMAKAVGQLLAGTHGALVDVRGPADLIEPVRSAFADNPAVVVTEAEVPGVSATAGDTTIASQIDAWSAALRAALEPAA